MKRRILFALMATPASIRSVRKCSKMKTLYIASALALLGGSAAHTETILDAFIGSDARLKIEDCGTDTCGTITLGKQKFVVKKSDISSLFKDLDIGEKPSSPLAKGRGKPAAGNRASATETAPAARADDRNASPGRRDEPAASRSDDWPPSRWD